MNNKIFCISLVQFTFKNQNVNISIQTKKQQSNIVHIHRYALYWCCQSLSFDFGVNNNKHTKHVIIKAVNIICWTIISKIIFLILFTRKRYKEPIIPAIIAISGSWIAYIQNHTPVGWIRKQRVSDNIPKNIPYVGPKIQPITMTNTMPIEILPTIPGMGILRKSKTIRNANNVAIKIIVFNDLNILIGDKGKKKLVNLLILFCLFIMIN